MRKELNIFVDPITQKSLRLKVDKKRFVGVDFANGKDKCVYALADNNGDIISIEVMEEALERFKGIKPSRIRLDEPNFNSVPVNITYGKRHVTQTPINDVGLVEKKEINEAKNPFNCKAYNTCSCVRHYSCEGCDKASLGCAVLEKNIGLD